MRVYGEDVNLFLCILFLFALGLLVYYYNKLKETKERLDGLTAVLYLIYLESRGIDEDTAIRMTQRKFFLTSDILLKADMARNNIRITAQEDAFKHLELLEIHDKIFSEEALKNEN